MVLAAAFGTGAYAAAIVPKIVVNGNQVKTSLQPKIIDGSVFVPIRAISDGLGASIQWNNANKTVYVDSDPDFKMEDSSVEYVNKRNLAFRWIMAYDERDHKGVLAQVSPNFTTDIYNESFPAGTYNMASIVDMKSVARTDNTLTVRIVQRVTAEDDYKVKIEKWKFTFEQGSKISSVKIVPNSAVYLDRYTLFPGASFGI
ncbi:copper amine oxidase N-terminal domain-containing protein [Paenibacillus sp. HN-1]|nr:copper amine oxidase N-terminal domain-containing protein [Paenibacillus sp. CGMCC 1.18879]MBY9087464.1 copper amine oxidase N-terminal domain-containing protein [Paenibacillus sinensis]